jgi:hypothetical protein
MIDEPELTFDDLKEPKAPRGMCTRCFEKPVAAYCAIEAKSLIGSKQKLFASASSSLCMDCTEITYRAIATLLTQPVMFRQDICPRCQKEKPIIGRVMIHAREQLGDHKSGGHPRFKSIATTTYRYCESCTVYSFRGVVQLRDHILEEGRPTTVTS